MTPLTKPPVRISPTGLVSNVQDPLARVEGVGSLQVFGAEYAMRIWLRPGQTGSYSLMPSDVQSAIEAQNVQVTAGKIGALPSPDTQQLTATVRAQSRLQTVDQFKNIIVKSQSDGAVVRIKDVARVRWAVKIIPLSANLTVTVCRGCCNAFARCECAEYGDAGQG
mgnify:CR=1 FL=1